tara:strand:+ start:186 stop:452 length:267 start_codon:yes stop_codon:yes gene_type:complete
VLSPKHLDGTNDRLKQAARLVRNRTGGVAEVGVTETGGAYNSGQRGTTDAFASTFWCAPRAPNGPNGPSWGAAVPGHQLATIRSSGRI